MASMTRITELATRIARDTAKVDEYRRAKGLPSPSFDADGPVDLVAGSSDIEAARMSAISASMELSDLLQGPVACLRPAVNATSLEAIYRWNIASHVPLNDVISYNDLAQKADLQERNLRRIVRYAIAYHRVFVEPRPGLVAHSAASRLLVDDPAAFDTLGMMFDESWQAFARVRTLQHPNRRALTPCTQTCDAMKKFNSQEPNETGYALAHDTEGKTMWEYYASHPTRGKRFATAMGAFTSFPGNALSYLVTGYPWETLEEKATIVDVGGSEGHVSYAIAAAHPKLKFVVQDLPEVMQAVQTAKIANGSLDERVEFAPYDFLTPQTRKGDVYLFRWVLHDWPDPYVVKILRNQIPMLVKGAKIVINEQLLPEPGSLPLVIEKQIRFFDLCMLSLFNSKERNGEDWTALLQEADDRFQNIKIWTPTGSSRSIIEATWQG